MGRKLLDLLLARRGFGVSLIGFGLAMVLLAFKPGDVADIGPSWFDIMNQVWQRDRISEPVVIVAIDEASIAEFGAWPWPRVQTAKLLERIAAGRPAAVGIDIFFSEVEGGSPAALAKRPGVPEDIRQWLLKQPSGDDVLAAGLATGPFIMAVGGTGEPASGPPEGMISQVIHLGEDPRAALARWRPAFAPLRSKPKFRDASEGEGVIALSTGFDGVARQTGQVFDIGGDVLAPGLAIEMLRMASGANHIVADADEDGVHRLTLLAGQDPVLQIDTEPNGTVRPWFGDRAIDREIPAIALLTDDNELARIEGKLVLVGYTAAGGLDEWLTPIEQVVPGVDIHRQTLEGIFDNRLLVRPDWAENAEFVLAIVLAFIGAFVPIRLRLGGGVALGVSLLIFPMAGALAVYMIGLITLDGATPMLIAFIAGGPSFAAHITLSERERRRSESVQSRIDGEMAAAKRMQMGILPNAVDVFPDEKRFSIAAISEPARTVGGDLYDFFLLDDRPLFFIVGDVAGKGPEASLFMAIAKSLCKSNALRGFDDLGAMLSVANTEIARDNPATMFDTAFAGILDVESGHLDFCCAGHEPPWYIQADGTLTRLEGIGGPPLCLLDEFDYPTDSIQLAPGDKLIVVTDGITEAVNRENELFGVERTDIVIDAISGATDASEALSGLVDPIHVFADGEEPADDLTALIVVWGAQT